jgi:hypothetical protein
MDFSLPHLWMRRICAGSIGQVLALYAPASVLLATYEAKPLLGHAQMAAYFREFMAKPGLCGTIDTLLIQRSSSWEVNSGLYTFRWRGGRVQARYTFVFDADPVQIATHHSSEVP